MTDISVIVCTRNPRPEYLQRALSALARQSLPKDKWELLVVDNASRERLADTVDLSWLPASRHIREEAPGLISARFRGISEARGQNLVFVDDDNVLAPNFLEEALSILDRYPQLGAVGAGTLAPEFEATPPEEIRPHLSLLALRRVPSARWSNNTSDHGSIPWGAGLCIRRPLACEYQPFVERNGLTAVLGRRDADLLSGDDDAFSWLAAAFGFGFGIFPQLRLTHLIGAERLNRRFVLRLMRGHAFSSGVLRHVLAGSELRRIDWIRRAHVLLHGVRNGYFSMQCQWAQSCGEDRAARFLSVTDQRNQPETYQLPRQFSSPALLDEAHEHGSGFAELAPLAAGNQRVASRRISA